MKARRAIIIASLVVVAAFLALFVFMTTISAQPGPPGAPPGGGAPPGMPGGPPGMPGMPGMDGMGGMGGAGAGGATLAWSETPADPLLVMSYPEFLARRGLRPSALPSGLIKDNEGEPKKRTDAEWAQLDQLYAGSAIKEEDPKPGGTGSRILADLQRQLAVIQKENNAMARAFAAARDGFTFEVGYPSYDPRAVNGQNLAVRVGVLMHVKPSLQKSYGTTVYNLLKPFDNYGTDRRRFSFVTYQGGYFHPAVLTLHPSSVALWEALWTNGTQVALVLQDSRGKPIQGATGTAGAGLTGNAPALIAYPPEIRRTPYFDYLMPEADRDFTGSRRLQVDFARGWYYEFNFTLDMEQIALLDKAKATFILPPYEVLAAGISQARRPDEIQGLVMGSVSGWVAQTGGDFVAGRGAGTAAGAGGGGGGAAAPGAGAPPPGVKQLVPGGAGPGYTAPTSFPIAPLPL